MKIEQRYKLGSCIVYPHEFAIQFDNCEKQSLQPKWIEVLNYLVENHPRIIPREELIDKIWDGNSYVGEKSLTNVIWNLRNSFKKEDETQEIIETIRKAGYRLFVEPITIELEENSIAGNNALESSNVSKRNLILTSLSLCFLLIISYWFYANNKPNVELATIETVTSDPGEELFVSISPNGRFIVYRMTNQDDAVNLYLKDLQQPNLPDKQLTFDKAIERLSVWSNDGKYLFYSRHDKKKKFCDYIQLDIFSQFERKIAKCPKEGKYYYLDISPDDKLLAFIGEDIEADEKGIYFLDLTQKNAKPVRFSCAKDCNYKDRDMAFSPDGNRLALTRRFHSNSEDIFIVDIATGESQRITEGVEDVRGLSWHSDNLHIVYGERKSGIRTGYWLNTVTKVKQSLNVEGFSFPAFNKVDNSLFYQQRLGNYQIKSLSIDQSVPSSAEPVLLSGFSQRQPHYSHSSQQIAFISNETGVNEIWLANKEGKERVQLTNMGVNISFPRWSHDGKKLAFLAPIKNTPGLKLYTINVATKKVSMLKTPYDDHERPSWSFNDDAIISAIDTDGIEDLFLLSIYSEAVKRITFDGGRFGVMTENNQLLYSRKKGGLWRKDISDETLQQASTMVIAPEFLKKRYFWSNTKGGIYFREDVKHGAQISFFEYSSKKITPLAKFPSNTFSYSSPLSVVPDESKLIFSVTEYGQSDIKRLRHTLFN